MSGFLGELLAGLLSEAGGLFAASKLGWLGKAASRVITSPAVQQTAANKISEFFMGADKEGKELKEELLTEDLLNFVSKDESEEIDAFVSKLRKEKDGEDKVNAFRIYLANGLEKGCRKRKDFISDPSDPKGKRANEVSYDLLDLEWGKGFIKRLLSRSTFQKRVQFLADHGVFSTIKKKKEPHHVVKKAKGFFSNLCPTDADMAEIERRYEESIRNKQNRRNP